MNLSLAIVATTLAVAAEASATTKWNNVRRRLSFEKIAGYKPDSQVTDHCAIDRDQAAIETLLAVATNESFDNARKIYNNGGNSKSYAALTLTEGLTSDVKKSQKIRGKDADGQEVSGKAYQDYDSGTQNIKVLYETTDIQSSYVQCQVGALQETNMRGCLTLDGTVEIAGTEHAYTYDPATENKNGRTIAGFSTGAESKMLTGCPGCPYTDFKYFHDYYGRSDYAHEWVEAAFEGRSTEFPQNGNANFATYSFDGREQAIKKGTALLSVFMYVIREFEDALDDCSKGLLSDNYNSVHAWDEGVCFYSGSIEGQDGLAGGKLLHQLADKRCANYKTCGADGVDGEGLAKVNYDIFDMLTLGNYQITRGNCDAARDTVEKIVAKMYVPMIQGSIRYAYKVDKLQGGETEKAEGAVFAAAVLPRVNAANPKAAQTIYNNLKVGAGSTDHAAVKSAFESVYADMGITCADVGGLWNEGTKDYFPGMSPCRTVVSSMSTEVVTESNNTLAIALGCTFGALFAIAAAMVVYMRSKEKEGKPVFKTSADDIKDMN